MKAKLGQNFLISKEIVNKAIDVANLDKTDIVLEIGPGKGIFTTKLVNYVEKVIAVEKDSALASLLEEKFESEIKEGKLEVVVKDILDFNPKILKGQTFTPHQGLTLGNFSYKIIANIPFYITGAILKKFLQSENQPNSMTLIIQKEVGERILARDGSARRSLGGGGKESILSISVKVYGEPKIVKNVPKKFFKPQPKVDSVILHIENISKNFFIENKIDEKKFFELVKTGFSSKRKYLSNNLKALTWKPGFQVPPKVRAEELDIKDWKVLYLTMR